MLGESRAVCEGDANDDESSARALTPRAPPGFSTGVDNLGDNRGVAVSGRTRRWFAEFESRDCRGRADGEGKTWYTFRNMTNGFPVSGRC